jgi:hypothetical protein
MRNYDPLADWRHALGPLPEPATDEELTFLNDTFSTPYEDYFADDLLKAYRLGKAAR